MLRNAKVKTYIDEKLKELESQKIMDVKEVLERLTVVGRGELVEEVATSMGDVITKKVSAKEQLKGLELLGKYHSLFTDKINADVNNTVVVLGGENDLEE